ncbi:MAG: ABC transporter ATP-binding protein [Chloroflexi bacterium 44-23]|nr:MAG: ABC transporter ATP-binding protein [Chloroflexi bacterium 44-23]
MESTPKTVLGSKIEGHGVSKTYFTRDGEVRALDLVDFTIQPGEFVSLIGPSGCGKSTLMLLVAGLLQRTTGSIQINGENLTKPLTDAGIVFQDHLLLDFRTAEDNILLQTQIRGLPKDASQTKANELLKQLGLANAAKRYPSQLSGGMRQRVSIARALIHDPDVLLMDEPFGALDAITRTQIRHDLEKLWLEKRNTVLFITHSVEEAVSLSDRILVMSSGPGRIIEEIKVDLPRPRPVKIGVDSAFVEHADRIYDIMRNLGVLTF